MGEIILLARRPLDEWDQGISKPKINVIIKSEFDNFDDVKDQLRGCDAFICALGSRVGTG